VSDDHPTSSAPEPASDAKPAVEPDAEPAAERAGPGTLGAWFWGSLLAFGVFLVAVPGQDTRGRTWLVVGIALAVVSVVGLTLWWRARVRGLRQDGGS
jgi:membrane protein implicated in regulation of membrane protease activity